MVIVTFAPLWVSVPSSQTDEMVCPLANDQVRVQLVMGFVPVLSMVMAPPKAVVLCGEIV